MTPLSRSPDGVLRITRDQVERGELPQLPPSITARVNMPERWRNTGSRFGDLTASGLTAILQQLNRGNPWDWADWCEFALATDTDLASLYATRLERILDRDWEVMPNEFGDPKLAQSAADLCHELLARIENWDQALKMLLHAIAVGYSAAECEWERDRTARLFYVRNILHRHGHRFRYGPSWTLRLYDRGQRPGADSYGEILDPRLWIVHQHYEQAGYPPIGGVMRACAYITLFARWAEKMRIARLEKFGAAIPVWEFPADTADDVREAGLAKLEEMSANGVFAVEQPGTIKLIAGTVASGGTEHHEYLADALAQRARLWLGTSDLSSPGEHGSQSAVGSRIDATTDPKTVADCKSIANTLHHSLLKNFIAFNAVKLGAPASQIPIPKLKAWKTEEDIQEADAPEPGMLGQGNRPSAGRIPEINLSRELDPKKAVASGEPRPRIKWKPLQRPVGRARKPLPMPSTSLRTRIDRLLRAG